VRKSIICILVASLLVLIPYLQSSGEDKLVSSRYSIKYHKPSCKQARKIQSQVRITFDTAKQARATGRIPCNVCKPPKD